MQTTSTEQTQLTTAQILLKLGIPAHRAGYEQLCIAIPHFAKDRTQSMNSELYILHKRDICQRVHSVQHFHDRSGQVLLQESLVLVIVPHSIHKGHKCRIQNY